MQHKRLVNALKKAGATVTRLDDGKPVTHQWGNPLTDEQIERQKLNQHWQAEGPAGTVDWHTDEDYRHPMDLDKICTGYVTKRSPHTDSQTDCFCDSYYRTIKAAIAATVGG